MGREVVQQRRNIKQPIIMRTRIEPSFGARREPPRREPPRRKRPRIKRKRRTLRRRTFKTQALRAFLLCGLWVAVFLGAAIAIFIASLPDPVVATLDDRPPNLTILASDGTVLAERGLRRGHVRLDKLPPYLIKAVIATEDRRFYHHLGVDPLGLVRASYANFVAGGVVEGGSTVTQQLAKNLFLKPERTITRKLEEVIYAIWLEQRFDKDEILELYLNRVYFGGGTYGVEAAARHYFGKTARTVTLSEAALLAGLLKAPSRYAPTRNATRAIARVDEVLDNMVEAGFLTAAEARMAASQKIVLRARGDETGYPYPVDLVAEQLDELVGENEGDLIVETTIDSGLQRVAQKVLRTEIDLEGADLHIGEGAVVVLDPSGGVKALVGGRSYQGSPFDRAVKSLRQPGSAFKPFVYLAGLESGYTPDSVANDAPINVSGWSPKNHTGTYGGEMTLRYSLAHSINTVAVKLAADVGRWKVVRTAKRLGIHSKLHDDPSIALGTAEVTLLDLTSAYAPFANGGVLAPPYIVARVRNGDGRIIFSHKNKTPVQVIAQAYIGPMNDMMNATIVYGTGKQAALPDHVAGGKTGTSQRSRDAWFVGYTAHYVAGVWVGNDDGSKMKSVTGGTVPARLWHDIMSYAHRGKPIIALPGTRMPKLEQADAKVPWTGSTPQPEAETRFFDRVLGVLGGG